MKPQRPHEPTRLLDAPGQPHDPAVGQARALLAAATPLTTWTPLERARVRRTVLARLAHPSTRRKTWVVSGLLLLISGGTVVAGFVAPRRKGPQVAVLTAAQESVRPAPQATPRGSEVGEARPETAAAAAAQESGPTGRRSSLTPRPVQHQRVRGVRLPREEPADVALLGRVFSALRRDRAPEVALAMLATDGAQLATGPLALEALTARVEALQALDRPGEALVALDAHAADHGLGVPLTVLRGELRAAAGRCPAARADFEQAARVKGVRDQLHQRCLYGIAICFMTEGDADRARQSLRTYLDAYPSGRFAETATAALNQLLTATGNQSGGHP